MTDDVIPELQLGIARLGGYKAATALANLNTARDARSAWIIGEYGSGLIRSMTSKQVLVEFGAELMDLNAGNPISESQLGKGGWWKKSVNLPRSEPLAQAYNSKNFIGLDLGGRAFITHRPTVTNSGLPGLDFESESDSD